MLRDRRRDERERNPSIIASTTTKNIMPKKSSPNNNKKPKLTKAERRAKYTQRARDRQLQQRHAQTVCYHCRKRGHAVAHCPQNAASKSICFKCGSTQHGLWKCPQLLSSKSDSTDFLPFATCFVCQQKGHLASSCPQNPHGVYVQGTGACQSCGSKQHRKSDCPQKQQQQQETQSAVQKDNNDDDKYLPKDSFDDLLPATSQDVASTKKSKDAQAKGARPKKRRKVNF